MTPRNKSTLPARQRKAVAHQDGARRSGEPVRRLGIALRCMNCSTVFPLLVEGPGEYVLHNDQICPACAGEERGE
jgi:hypothetical protein